MQDPSIAAYALLAASISALWLPPCMRIRMIKPWMILLWMSVAAAWLSGLIDARALASILLLALSCVITENKSYRRGVRIAAAALFVLMAAGLATHALPGFHNITIIEEARISRDGLPYSLHLNFDKALIGVFLLGFGHYLRCEKRGLAATLKIYAGVTGATAAVLLPFSVLAVYVDFDLKLSPYLASWAFANLFITCLSEEAFFRGFIQSHLQRILRSYALGSMTALLFTSALFGLAHSAGGPVYVLLAALAGVGYGMSYQLTGRIEAAMFTHFTVNLLHFLFFTYPALPDSEI